MMHNNPVFEEDVGALKSCMLSRYILHVRHKGDVLFHEAVLNSPAVVVSR